MSAAGSSHFHRRGRLLTGHFHEDGRYRQRRRQGSADHLFFCCLDGAGFLASGAHRILLEAGAVGCFRPGCPQDYGTDPATGRWEFLWVHVQVRPHWEDLLGWSRTAAPGWRRPGDPLLTQRVTSAFAEMHALASGGHRQAEDLAANALERALLWLAEDPPGDPPMDGRIRRALEHLHAHLDRPLRVAELARVAGCSASRFAHLFSAILGSSPAAYLEAERLRRAAELLLHGELSVAAIAGQLGYRDPAYFNARFRRRHGLAPGRWRLRQRAEPPTARR